MRHVCESLSLDELEEAFNSQVMNVVILDMIEICDELPSSCDDRLLKDCDLLFFREYGTGFAPALGGTRTGLRACEMWSGLTPRLNGLERHVVLR